MCSADLLTPDPIPIETCSLPALTHVLPPIRPVGFPIYVARRPAAPFARSYPRHFTFYVPDPISSIDTDLFLPEFSLRRVCELASF
jgi:hypothetical protein